jgi:outer membrane protein assembly factor BamB
MNRKKVALALVPVLLLGAVGAVEGPRWWGRQCEQLAGRVPADQPLPLIRSSTAANVDLSGFSHSPRARAERVLAQARRIPPSVGTLRSVVVAPSKKYLAPNDEVRLVGAADGEPLLLIDQMQISGKPAVNAGVVTRIDTKSGGPSWARWYDDYMLKAISSSEGLVTVQRNPGAQAPQAASFAPATGELQWCISIGDDWVPRDSGLDLAAGDGGVFAVHGERRVQADREPTLIALDPASGRHRWKKRIEGFVDGGSVDVFGHMVLVTQWDISAVQNTTFGRLKADPVRAFSTADGTAGWEYRGPDPTGWSNTVIGVRDTTAVVLARHTRAVPQPTDGSQPTYDARRNQNWLIGLGPDGKERWRQDLGNRVGTVPEWNGVRVAGDTVLTFETQGGGEGGPQTVVARDVATGRARWTKTFPEHEILSIDRSAVVGNSLILPHASKDLVAVDLATGAMRMLLTSDELLDRSDIAVDDRSVIVQTAGLVLTFDRGPF